MIKPAPAQIFMLKRPPLRISTHPHPALFIRVTATTASINFMSSEFNLYRPSHDFAIYQRDVSASELKSTGLSKDTYLIRDAVVYDYPLTGFDGVFMGELIGDLKRSIEDWWGELIV